MPQGVPGGGWGSSICVMAVKATRGPWGKRLARGLLIRVTDLSGENVPGLSGGFIRMATNGVDDRQKTMAHCGGQRRPSVNHALKIRCNGCGLVRAMRRIMRRLF